MLDAKRTLKTAYLSFEILSKNPDFIIMDGLIRIKTDSDYLINAVNPGCLPRPIPEGGVFVFISVPPHDWKTGPRRTFVSFIGAFMDFVRLDEEDIFPTQRGHIIPFYSEEENEKIFKFLQCIPLFGVDAKYIEEANNELPFNVEAVKKYCDEFNYTFDRSRYFEYVKYPEEFVTFVSGIVAVM